MDSPAWIRLETHGACWGGIPAAGNRGGLRLIRRFGQEQGDAGRRQEYE